MVWRLEGTTAGETPWDALRTTRSIRQSLSLSRSPNGGAASTGDRSIDHREIGSLKEVGKVTVRTRIEVREARGRKEMRSDGCQMANSITPAVRAEAEEAMLNYPQQQTNIAKLKMATMMMIVEGVSSKGGRKRG